MGSSSNFGRTSLWPVVVGLLFVFALWLATRADETLPRPGTSLEDAEYGQPNVAIAPERPPARQALQETRLRLYVQSLGGNAIEAAAIRCPSGEVATTDRDGMSLIDMGVDRVVVTHPDYSPASFEIGQSDWLSGTRTVFLSEGGRLRLVVRDLGGDPVQDAKVSLVRGSAIEGSSEVEEDADAWVRHLAFDNTNHSVYYRSGLTSDAGEVLFGALEGGMHSMQWQKWGYVPVDRGPDQMTLASRAVNVSSGSERYEEAVVQRLYGVVVRVLNQTNCSDETLRSMIGSDFPYPRGLGSLPPVHSRIEEEVTDHLLSIAEEKPGDYATVLTMIARQIRPSALLESTITLFAQGTELGAVPITLIPVDQLVASDVIDFTVSAEVATGSIEIQSVWPTKVERADVQYAFAAIVDGASDNNAQIVEVPAGVYRIQPSALSGSAECSHEVHVVAGEVAHVDITAAPIGRLLVVVSDAAGRRTSRYHLVVECGGRRRLIVGEGTGAVAEIEGPAGVCSLELYDLEFKLAEVAEATIVADSKSEVALSF